MVKQIPNLFTLLNLVFGCMACVAALQPGIIMTADNSGQLYYDVPEQIWLASLFILAGAVVDYFDGLLARLLKASSAMGRELDSLSDVVSFGVAPSLILYQFLRLSWAQGEQALDQSVYLLWPAFLLPAAAAWRLARFSEYYYCLLYCYCFCNGWLFRLLLWSMFSYLCFSKSCLHELYSRN